MGKRKALVAAYMEALPAKALTIHAGPNGRPSKIGFGFEKKLDLFDALWFAKAAHAELVLMNCRSDFGAIGAARPDNWIDLAACEVRDHIVNIATGLGASWRSGSELQADAARAVDEILASVEAQRRTGGLARVNAEYKFYRQQQTAKGAKAVPYSAHLAAFTRSLVVLAAVNANQI